MLTGINDEELITVAPGNTGDVRVYVSQPEWTRCAAAGVRPLSIRVEPMRGLVFPSNGTLRFTLIAEGYSGAEVGVSYVDIPLVAGEANATATLNDNRLTFVVRDRYSCSLNGRDLRGQSASMYTYGLHRVPNANECGSIAIFMSQSTSGKNPARRQAWNELSKSSAFHFSSTLRSNPQAPVSISYCDVGRFPKDWMTLAGLGQIAIEIEDLRLLKPDELRALDRFVRAGGVLSVCNVRSRSEIQKLLNLDLGAVLSKKDLELFEVDRRSNGVTNMYGETQLDMSADRMFVTAYDPIPDSHFDQFVQNRLRNELELYTYRRPGLIRDSVDVPPYQMPKDVFELFEEAGRVALIATRDFADWNYGNLGSFGSVVSRLDWRVPGDGIDSLEQEVLVEHGFGLVHLDYHSLIDGDCVVNERMFGRDKSYVSRLQNRMSRYAGGLGSEYWDWMIPSVGKTPVWAFLGLILLITGIGMPAAWISSRRRARRVLVLIFVPAIALISTFFLVSYAVVKDGFGARARIRSIATLDKEGNGMAWSRQSYFAGSVPSSGVYVRPETEVIDLGRAPNQFCSLHHSEDGQRYTGLIAPRTQCQFSVTHPIEGLNVFQRGPEIDTTIDQPVIKNAMAEAWLEAVIVDEKGRIFYASKTMPNETASWTSVTTADARDILRKAYNREPLEAPEDAPKAYSRSLLDVFFGLSWLLPNRGMNYNSNTQRLSEEQRWSRLAGGDAIFVPGTYAIYCERGSAIQRLLGNTVEADSLHVITGQW